jgi:hypothetical protein
MSTLIKNLFHVLIKIKKGFFVEVRDSQKSYNFTNDKSCPKNFKTKIYFTSTVLMTKRHLKSIYYVKEFAMQIS